MTIRVFDTEVTDLEHKEIIEAAYQTLSDDLRSTSDYYCQRFSPTRPISLGAMAVHHIVEEDLMLEDPSSTFVLPPDTTYLIGHNIDFDWEAAGKPNVKRICTLALSRWLSPTIDSHTLTAMMYYAFGYEARDLVKGVHSAGVDVGNCTKLLLDFLIPAINRRLRDKGKREITTAERLWEVSEVARIPTVMPFGKHKGVQINRVPGDYLQWLRRQPDTDAYMTKAIDNVIKRA